jgi:hypothetical protein
VRGHAQALQEKLWQPVAAPGVFLGMQVNTHDFCKTMFTVAKQ